VLAESGEEAHMPLRAAIAMQEIIVLSTNLRRDQGTIISPSCFPSLPFAFRDFLRLMPVA
jgi:hypothetical protein